jgi:hypothetical protein
VSHRRLLGVLLCYNDADVLGDALTHLLETNHDVVVWDHGSTDRTPDVLSTFARDLMERTRIPRSVDFYDLYPLMSEHLLARYADRYDWISWPDQDELLEGPDRTVRYDHHLEEAIASPGNWIVFNDLTFWYTERDDPTVESPIARVRHYSLAAHAMPRIRSWRAAVTNIRWFNHNPLRGQPVAARFNLRHYPMRSEDQMRRRLATDRKHVARGSINFHYDNMAAALARTRVAAHQLHYDDGVGPLNVTPKFDWSALYGSPPPRSADTARATFASFARHMSFVLRAALTRAPHAEPFAAGCARLARWRAAADTTVLPLTVLVSRRDAAIASCGETGDPAAGVSEAIVRGVEVPVRPHGVSASVRASRNTVVVRLPEIVATRVPPLVALLREADDGEHRFRPLDASGSARFEPLEPGRYWLAIEPPAAPARDGVPS